MRDCLTIAPTAQRDIDAALATSLRDFGLEQCLAYGDLIDDALDEIADEPNGFRSKSRPEFGASMRSLHIGRRGRAGRHVLFYRLLADGSIEVPRVLHDSMEPRLHLPVEF